MSEDKYVIMDDIGPVATNETSPAPVLPTSPKRKRISVLDYLPVNPLHKNIFVGFLLFALFLIGLLTGVLIERKHGSG